MKQPAYILLRLLLALVPLLTALAPATGQNSVYAGDTSTLSVVPVPGDTYVWELYTDDTSVNFATTPGNCPPGDAYFLNGISTGPSVQVVWNTPGTYFFKVTAYRGTCTMNLKIGQMIVLNELPVATLSQPPPICTGDQGALTVNLFGTPPWSVTIEATDDANGTTTFTVNDIPSGPHTIPVSPTINTTYRVVSVTDAHGTNNEPSDPVTLIVKPRPSVSPIRHY